MISVDKFKYKEYIDLRDFYKNKVDSIAGIRMFVFIFMVVSFCLGSSNFIFNILGVVLLGIFIFLIIIHDKYYKLMDYYNKYVLILEQYRSRIDGKWKDFDDKGEDFKGELLNDLDVVGDNSLFQYLSVCKTSGGRSKLIDKLSNKKISISIIRNNQEVIKELCEKINFVVDFQVNMLKYDKKKINLTNNFKYIDRDIGKKDIDFVIGIIFILITWILLLLGLFKIININYFYGMFMFNFLANFMYSYIYREEFDNISRISNDYSKLSSIYKNILGKNFNSKILKNMQNNISKSFVSISRLVRIDELNSLKNNILSSFIFNGLFSINIVVMFMYSKFLCNNDIYLKNGISAIEELEAFVSLATIGLVNDKVCMPDLVDDLVIDFKNLKHPLLDSKICVGNDFSGRDGVNIITGSNMGGKTSFLRTRGINMLLMNAGSYVCADSFKGGYVKIFTSLNVADDIDKGISTFYGELLRIKKAMDYTSGNRLVLVDEIFKGTNYQDRIYGAVNVIKKLNDKKTILFITTHDFELCDVKAKNLVNYYVKEYYEGDNIKFDYKIRVGKCESTNAKYLMKKLNIID